MGITPHNRISTKHQKGRGCAPGGFRTIINKQEGGTLYQKTRDSWLFIPRPFGTICKQPDPTLITPTMFLWLLTDQDTTHDLINAKQMTNKTDIYWKVKPGRSLPPDTCKRKNCVDMHSNSRQARFSLPVVTFWYHTCTGRIYNCQWSGNIPSKWSTLGRILGHR